MSYIHTIINACLFFPLIALLITLPYIFHHYHKYGAIKLFRTIVIYSFVLYLIVAYFLIILPLPSLEEVANLTTPKVQLIPLKFIYDIITQVNFSSNILKQPEIYQVLFNLILTMPFGIYLKYYFNCNFKKTIILSFSLSLFFELTQLSGLYFIYPRPYRLFDVDDLIMNTLGGTIGYLIGILIVKILPSRKKIELDSYTKGTKVTFTKRIFSHGLDIIATSMIITIIDIIIKLFNINLPNQTISITGFLIAYCIIPSITKGKTIGKKLTNMRIVKLDNINCQWDNYLIRYFLMYSFLIGIPLLIMKLYLSFYKLLDKKILIAITVIYALIFIIISILIFIKNIIKKELFIYEKISKTKNISTIIIPNEIEDSK